MPGVRRRFHDLEEVRMHSGPQVAPTKSDLTQLSRNVCVLDYDFVNACCDERVHIMQELCALRSLQASFSSTQAEVFRHVR